MTNNPSTGAGKLPLEVSILILETFEESLRDGLDVQRTLRRLEVAFSKIGKAQIIENMRRIIYETHASIGAGFKGVVDDNLLQVIEVGENRGDLDKVFGQLKALYELRLLVRQKIAAAIRYPMGIMIVIAAMTFCCMIFLIPQIEQIFKSIPKNELPAFNRSLFAISAFAKTHWIACSTGTVVGLASIWAFMRKHEELLFQLPIVRKIMILQEDAMTYMLLAVYAQSGMAYDVIFNSLAKSLAGPLKQVLEKAAVQLGHGATVAQAFERGGADQEVVLYIEAKEGSQRLEAAFQKLADLTAKNLQKRLEIMSKVLSYTMLVLAAVMLFVLLGASLYPIYDLASRVR